MSHDRNGLIEGAPMREPSHFTGPVAWWNETLTCGGVERQIVASAKAFQERGLPVVLLCRSVSSGGKGFFLHEARQCCRHVLEFSDYKVDAGRFATARRMAGSFVGSACSAFTDTVAAYADWLVRARPRLLHIWNADSLEILLAAVMAGVPGIIIAGRSLSPAQRAPCGFESVNAPLALAVLTAVMRLPHVAMTNNSRAGCAAYEAWLGLPPGTVTLTPNIFDLRQWPRPEARRVDALRRELGMAEGAPVLGGLFRFISVKDPDLWVETALLACAADAGLYAVAGGHGPRMAALRARVARSPLAGRVLFPGPIRDVPAFLSLCSVLLHTAHVEGLPNVLLEAQAHEVPVVTTKCGGAVDVVEHGKSGFIVEERTSAALLRRTRDLLDHPETGKAMGRAGREKVARDFSPERSLGKLWAVYETLPGAKPS